MKVGAAEMSITPPARGTLLIGPLEPSTGVHDELFARALVLDDGRQCLALVTMDLVGLDFGMVERLSLEIEQRTHIPPSHVMINCSHTHSAPFTVPWSVVGWETFEREMATWRDDLLDKVAATVRLAVSRLQPATLRFGREPVQIGSNRRLPTANGIQMSPNPRGPVVPWTDVLRADSSEGEPIMVLMSHAAHPVIVHGASTLISADYPGYAVSEVRRLLGAGVVAMFAQACGANINADPLRGGFEEACRAGTILGAAAVKAALQSEVLRVTRLRCLSADLALPFQPAPPVERVQGMMAEGQRRLEDLQKSGTHGSEIWYAQDNMRCYRELLEHARRRERRTLRFQMQAFALGCDLCLLGLSHEVFAEYQLAADQMSPFKYTMVLGYTNGCESYIPCQHDFHLGGYESADVPHPAAPLRYRNRLTLEPDIESQIKTAMAELLSRLAAQVGV